MENFEDVLKLAQRLLEQNDDYIAKPTKAERARMRSTMNDLKKLITPAKKELSELDKPTEA